MKQGYTDNSRIWSKYWSCITYWDILGHFVISSRTRNFSERNVVQLFSLSHNTRNSILCVKYIGHPAICVMDKKVLLKLSFALLNGLNTEKCFLTWRKGYWPVYILLVQQKTHSEWLYTQQHYCYCSHPPPSSHPEIVTVSHNGWVQLAGQMPSLCKWLRHRLSICSGQLSIFGIQSTTL